MLIFVTSCAPSNQGADVKEISFASMIEVESRISPSELRVAAVGNGAAEILVAMGLGNLIVGRDIASEIDELVDVPLVTNGHNLSAERVLALRPDLIIVDPNTTPRSALTQVERAGVEVVEIPERYDLDGISAKIDSIASALNLPEIGRALKKEIGDALADVGDRGDGDRSRVLFLYLRGGNGIFLVGGRDSGADVILDAAGAIDLGATLYKNPFTPINSEAILALKPDIYLLMSAGLESVGGLDAFRELPGIDPSIPVITVDDSLLLSFGPRTPDLIRQLNEAIYGDR